MESGLTEKKKKKGRERERRKKKGKKRLLVVVLVQHKLNNFEETNHTHTGSSVLRSADGVGLITTTKLLLQTCLNG